MRRAAVVAIVVLLAGVLPGPAALAQSSDGPTVFVAPTCLRPGVPTRIVILGTGWGNGDVQLFTDVNEQQNQVGTATARTSPGLSVPGSFTFTTTITVANNTSTRITAYRGDIFGASQFFDIQPRCPSQISVKPPCLSAPGKVEVTGAGWVAGLVSVGSDPYGDAEAAPQTATADKPGNFVITIDVPYRGGVVPIVASQSISGVLGAPSQTRAVAFVEPCPPKPTVTTNTTVRPPDTTATTAPRIGATTTTVVPPEIPPRLPPELPPAAVSISPRTVRPGRCNVIGISAAPPGLAVVARFADVGGPPATGQIGPGGGAVVSVCHSHDSGMALGPVKVLLAIGPVAPVPVFTVLRVPARPEPPLLQAGADTRRS